MRRSERSGKFTTSLGTELSNLPAFCRVVGYATPTPQSHIGFEVWLPEKNWSGRYVQVGNGGLAGIIWHHLLGQMLERGHATASTDNGHTGKPGRRSLGDRPAGEGPRLTPSAPCTCSATSASEITAHYYENAAKRSYFFGCSEGGREALIEAQRFPQDFDGIVAGAPAQLLDRSVERLRAAARRCTRIRRASFRRPSCRSFSRPRSRRAMPSDGVKDGIVSAPEKCKFDPQVLACTSGS